MEKKRIKAQEKAIKKQEKAIKKIILRYGETINLKKSPYLLVEIFREYSSIFGPLTELDDDGSSGPVPGSHGTPDPPPDPDPDELLDLRRKYNILTGDLSLLSNKVIMLEEKLKGFSR